MSVRSTLRSMLRNGEPIIAPGGYDALTTKIVEHLGFKVAYMGGWITGAHLGTTEPLLTLTEQVGNASWAVRVLNVPLIVDAHGGFGDALHVMRAVREYEYAGVSAIHLEDQLFPKRVHYHRGLEHVIPIPEYVQKLKAALEARKDPDFIIIGRTDARNAVSGSLAEAIRRAHAAIEAGVDVVSPQLRDPKDMEVFRKEVPDIPLSCSPRFNGLTIQQCLDLGYQQILYPVASIIAAAGGVIDLYRELKETGQLKFDQGRADSIRETIEKCISLDKFLEIEARTVEASGS